MIHLRDVADRLGPVLRLPTIRRGTASPRVASAPGRLVTRGSRLPAGHRACAILPPRAPPGLARMVDVVDAATGTVRLKKQVDDADEMALDTRSTKTVRTRK
jgi:von Willebrand factor type A C-terminal domain